jgi:hypothetical protein
MPTTPAADEVVRIAKRHLGIVAKYNPYQSFPGITDRAAFGNLIGRDPAFSALGFDDPRYIVARIGGNLITSLHKKIGDMYEEIFEYLLRCRFDLTPENLAFQVKLKIGRRTQVRSTDGWVPIDRLSGAILPGLPKGWARSGGLAFELRSCYQIGDSKRIQADWDMALALRKQHNLTPVMLILCGTSLRSPVERLSKSWHLYEGDEAFAFIARLTGFDLRQCLEANRETLTAEVGRSLAKL